MDKKRNSEFLKQLMDQCKAIQETIHLWSQVADFYKDNPDNKKQSEIIRVKKEDVEKMLEILE